MDCVTCRGCGGNYERLDGPVHAYMESSPGCWAAFGRVLAAEFGDPELSEVHRLSVDTYAVQHPGGSSRRAIQSVGLHLARLFLQLESSLSPGDANDLMLALGRHKETLPFLPRPRVFRMTVADIQSALRTVGHAGAVRQWAECTFEDWQASHIFIRQWVRESLRWTD